jgi:putative inorganic carbon (HCO3(-)) transporter
MRDFIVMAIIVGSAPLCLISPYFGVLMWYWVTYFNPHRFTWGFAYAFPVALVIAVPTLIGTVFARKSLRALLTSEGLLLLALWAWYTITYIHATTVPFFVGHMKDAQYEMSHVSKILLMSFVTILMISTRERLKAMMMVTAGSLGLLAVKGTLFGLRTGGESRVWGPPDSFLTDNNAFALAMNMCLPILYYLAREEKNRWMRLALRICFVCCILSVLLTYSRGGMLGLIAVLAAITLKGRHKIRGAGLILASIGLLITFAPGAWMDRMGQFAQGNLDTSADERLVSWGTSWHFAHDYPVTGGGFDALPDVNIFQRYELRPLPDGFPSSGPHSIYFQLLADHGFVGLGLFLLLIGSCIRTLYRVRSAARRIPGARWLVAYTQMVEIAILAFLTSGAFLGFVYLDVIYQMIGVVVILKILIRELALAARREQDEPPIPSLQQEEVALFA